MMFDAWEDFGNNEEYTDEEYTEDYQNVLDNYFINTEEYEKQIIFKLYLIEITFTRQILIEKNPTAMLRIFLKKTQR